MRKEVKGFYVLNDTLVVKGLNVSMLYVSDNKVVRVRVVSSNSTIYAGGGNSSQEL